MFLVDGISLIKINLKIPLNNSEHTLCVSNYGEAFSWGLGNDGQLGLGNNKKMTNFPVKIEFFSEYGISISSVKAGTFHSAAYSCKMYKKYMRNSWIY